MAAFHLISGLLFFVTPVPEPSTLLRPSPRVDQTRELQSAIDSLPVNGILDCGNRSYVVAALQLKSNMTLQNCEFETTPGAIDFAAPVTIDGRSGNKSNIVIENVHVRGNRHAQSNIGYAGEEDGGRHCFRLLGNVSNVGINRSSGTNCASDGIALVSYGVKTSDKPDELPFQHITIRNSDFSFNRRHGASADGIRDLSFYNVTFSHNGTSLTGGLEGDRCASSGGLCYGTGFWYEDYRPGIAGEGMHGLSFSHCTFRQNFQRSIFIYTRGLPSVTGFKPRSGLRILNSYLDSGAQPLAEDYALQFQVEDPLIGTSAVFQDVFIQDTFFEGSLGFRQVANVSVNSSQIQTRIPYMGYAAYSTDFTFRNVQASGKLLATALDPGGRNSTLVSYSTTLSRQYHGAMPPDAGSNVKGDVVWNTETGSGVTGWVCVAEGSPCTRWQSF